MLQVLCHERHGEATNVFVEGGPLRAAPPCQLTRACSLGAPAGLTGNCPLRRAGRRRDDGHGRGLAESEKKKPKEGNSPGEAGERG